MFHKIEIPIGTQKPLCYVYLQLPLAHLNTLFCVRLCIIMEIPYIRYIGVCITSLGDCISEQKERVATVFGSFTQENKTKHRLCLSPDTLEQRNRLIE